MNRENIISSYISTILELININTILGWNDDHKYSVSTDGNSIYKRLFTASEQSLAGMLTGRKNPVGVLGILNHVHAWSMPGVSHETVNKRSITAAELPKLGKSHNSEPYQIQDNSTNTPKKS